MKSPIKQAIALATVLMSSNLVFADILPSHQSSNANSTNVIDCSIDPHDRSFDRIVLSANDSTGEVGYVSFKNGVQDERESLPSDSYTLLDQNDLSHDSALRAEVARVAGQVNVDLSRVNTVVRFDLSGNGNFIALKFISNGRAPVSALSVLSTVFRCH